MKKVAVSKETVFDDPLFNPGDSFQETSNFEKPAPETFSKESHEPEVLTAPVVSRKQVTPNANISSRDKVTSTTTPFSKFPVNANKNEIAKESCSHLPKTTTKSAQISSLQDEHDDDLFLPRKEKPRTDKKEIFEEELFGHPISSGLHSDAVSGKNLRLGTHDSDSDNEIDDLGVGAIMERENLDFDMFGKSNIRQYEQRKSSDGNTADKTGKIRKDDLELESTDVLDEFESFVSLKEDKTPRAPISSSNSLSNNESSSVVLDSSHDIDAYISQQEESSGGLFD